ncbi:MAG TPA: ribosome recycling factor [Pseudomonadales bacterium]|nr:ribosome recycling factor [Pseudomonadales bacterium]
MIDDIRKDAEARMDKSIESLQTAFARIRTGRASPNLLDDIRIDYYGTETPLNQVANINVEDGRSLVISPWEKKLVPLIEKAIHKSDLGLSPNTTGDVIRLPMPPLTEESRKGLTKQARAEAENARISVRSVRRDANTLVKELLKEKEISEDEERKAEDAIQKLTDRYVARVDELLAEKETDLMEI